MTEGIVDYLQTCEMATIGFSRGENALEVMAIAPWQIEKLSDSVDLIWNSCSFQEMTLMQVENYARFIEKLMAKSSAPEICLTMYNYEAPTSRPDVINAFKHSAFEQVPARRKFWPIPPYEEYHFIGRKQAPVAR